MPKATNQRGEGAFSLVGGVVMTIVLIAVLRLFGFDLLGPIDTASNWVGAEIITPVGNAIGRLLKEGF
jgi:hypothetical protein